MTVKELKAVLRQVQDDTVDVLIVTRWKEFGVAQARVASDRDGNTVLSIYSQEPATPEP